MFQSAPCRAFASSNASGREISIQSVTHAYHAICAGSLALLSGCGELNRRGTGTLKVVASTTSHSPCIRYASPHANCGVSRQTRAIPCTLIYGKLILNPRDTIAQSEKLAELPRL